LQIFAGLIFPVRVGIDGIERVNGFGVVADDYFIGCTRREDWIRLGSVATDTPRRQRLGLRSSPTARTYG
jgi:hypothetical protein